MEALDDKPRDRAPGISGLGAVVMGWVRRMGGRGNKESAPTSVAGAPNAGRRMGERGSEGSLSTFDAGGAMDGRSSEESLSTSKAPTLNPSLNTVISR